MSRVRGGVDGGVAGIPLPDPAQEVAPPSIGGTACRTGPQSIYGILPRADRSIGCPVGVCEERTMVRNNLWIHFVHCHLLDTVVILEEGNRPHPR